MRPGAVFMLAIATAQVYAQSGQVTLPDALAFGKSHSPALRAAKAELLSVLATERGAHAMTGPQISANGLTTTGNDSAIFGPVPGPSPSAIMQVPSGQFSGANLMVMVPILAADVTALASSAKWQSRAAAGDYKEAEADLELAIREVFYAAKVAEDDLRTSKATLDALTELLRTTEAKFEAGKTIEASVQRVLADLKRAERDVRSNQNAVAKARLELLRVMGGSLDSQVELPTTEPAAKVTIEAADLVQSALINRGAMIASTARSVASEAELRAAKALGQPRFYATGMLGATSRRDMGGLALGIAMSVPIFDGGLVRAGVERARSMKARAEAELTDTRLMVEMQVRKAVLDQATAAANVRSAEAEVLAATEAYAVTAVRVEAGKAILLEQLDALDLLTRAKTELSKARLEAQRANARLLRATGGSQ